MVGACGPKCLKPMEMAQNSGGKWSSGLYRREEHDACGVGFVAQLGEAPSHRVVEQALEALGCLTHRGGVDADGASGDGAGVLIQLPSAFFAHEAQRLNSSFNPTWKIAVGVFFLPQEGVRRARAMFLAEEAVHNRGLYLAGWRQVPLDDKALEPQARETQPAIWHHLVARPADHARPSPLRYNKPSALFLSTNHAPEQTPSVRGRAPDGTPPY